VLEFVRVEGAGTMPVLVVAAMQVGLACVLVARPRRTVLALAIGAAAATLLSRAMGTWMGIRACVASGDLDARLRHCLHPLILGVAITSLGVPIPTIGVYRLAQERA
jgi:hypothetical protein